MSLRIVSLNFAVAIAASQLLLSVAFAQAPQQAPIDPTQAAKGRMDAVNSVFAGFTEPFEYENRNNRDPFQQPIPDVPVQQGALHGPVLPLQKYDLGQLRLVGIIWDVRRPKAMIKDPTGNTHIVATNTKVGPKNGYIAVIREGEIVVVETIEQDGRLVSSAQVVKIAR